MPPAAQEGDDSKRRSRQAPGTTTPRSARAQQATRRDAGEPELDVFHRLSDGHRFDGLIFARARPSDPRIAFCKERGLRFVRLGRSAGADEFPCVDVDHGLAAQVVEGDMTEQSGDEIAAALLARSPFPSAFI